MKEEIPASRKLGASDAKAIAKESSKVYVAKGKKLDVFDMKTAKLGEVAEKMLANDCFHNVAGGQTHKYDLG